MPLKASRDAQAVRRREQTLARISLTSLYVFGLYLIVAPFLFPEALGWTAATEAFGEAGILRIAVAFLFFYFATLTREKYRLKFMVEDVLEALNTLLFGKDYRRHREAVEILLTSLSAPDSRIRAKAVDALQKITGQAFGDDPPAWRKWWEINQRSFRAKVVHSVSSAEGGETAGPSA